MIRRVKVRVTRIRQRVVQQQNPAPRQHCPLCRRAVEALTIAEAAQALEIDEQRLAFLIGDGSLHTIQPVSGNLLVCRESLFLR